MADVLAALRGDETSASSFPIPANWRLSEGGGWWASGDRSLVEHPASLVDAGALDVFLTVEPRPGTIADQTIRIVSGDDLIREISFSTKVLFCFHLRNERSAGPCSQLFEIEHMTRGQSDDRDRSLGLVDLTVTRHKAWRPTPSSQLTPPVAPSSPAPADVSDEALLQRFASLGDNCEFGLVQRRLGADPTDLLRFVGIGFAGLLEGFDSDFDRLDTIDDFHFKTAGGEYIFVNRHLRIEMHTLMFEGQYAPDQLFHRQITKIGLQRRLLLEDLQTSRRIFVYKQNHDLSEGDMVRLFDRLQAKAPNILLVVTLADASNAPGTVVRLRDRLLRGYIDAFRPYDDAGGLGSQHWLEICRAAHGVWAEETTRVSPQTIGLSA